MSSTFNYYTVLEDNFKTSSNVYSYFKQTKKIDIPAKCNNHSFYSEQDGAFVPLIIGGIVLGYINCAINKGQLPNFVVFTPDVIEEYSKNSSLKLLPQTVKMLNNIPLGTRLCSDNFITYNRSGQMSMKIRPNEAIKAILLGYLNLPTDEVLLNYLCSRWDIKDALSRMAKDPLTKKAAVVDTLINHANKPWNSWDCKAVGNSVGYRLSRTTKTFDKDHVIKWRKPPKNSAWPWTLDHHWFEIQESPITLANYTFKALLSGNSNNKTDKVNNQYPIFDKKLTLEHGRKLLEAFFINALEKRNSNSWTWVVQQTSNMRWVTDNPCYIIPKLCLVMGVAPKFNDSGKFVKFVPIQNNISTPTKKLYIDLDNFNIDQGQELTPFLVSTFALCYELGLVPLTFIENYFGIQDGGIALANSSNYLKSPIGNHVVCCIPKTFSYDVAAKALAKHNSRTEKQKTDYMNSTM